MSSIKLSPNASGTGEFTIAAPNSNTNRTLTLPDATGTFNISGAVNEVPAGSASAPSIYPTGDTNTGEFFPAADTIAWTTGGTERGRFTSGGYFKASNTGNYLNSGGGYHELVSDSTSQAVAVVYNSSASQANDAFQVITTRNTTNGTYTAIAFYNNTAGAYKFKVLDSGNVQNTNNSYGALSDAKLKENVVDTTPKLEKLNQVRIVNYNLIGNEQKQLGVIAQELEQVFPGMVEETPDRDAEGNDLGTTTKSVKYSVFVPMLIKAVQELNAKVAALEARLTSDGPSNGGQA